MPAGNQPSRASRFHASADACHVGAATAKVKAVVADRLSPAANGRVGHPEPEGDAVAVATDEFVPEHVWSHGDRCCAAPCDRPELALANTKRPDAGSRRVAADASLSGLARKFAHVSV